MSIKNKKLYKSRKNKIISGVAGGLAEYLNVDPFVVRFIFALFSFFNGIGVLIYFLMSFLLPYEDEAKSNVDVIDITPDKNKLNNIFKGEDGKRNLLAFIVLVIGLMILADKIFPNIFISFDYIWPIIIIILGIILFSKNK